MGTLHVWAYPEKFNIDFFARPLNMYWKSPRKFERKIRCKIFHGRPLFGGELFSETQKMFAHLAKSIYEEVG